MRPPSVKLNHGNSVLWIFGASLLMLIGIVVAGYDLWYQSYYYVASDFAQVVGSVTEVLMPSASRITGLDAGLGGRIEAGERIAVLQPVGSPEAAADLIAPRGGVVVGLYAREGQLAFAGQPVLALAEPSELWIVANVSETSAGDVRIGQAAEIQLVSLDREIPGQVVEILAGSSRAAGSSTLSTVPVRIALAGDASDLHPGMAAYVKIRVR
jgi:multidrug resistance efflux pump